MRKTHDTLKDAALLILVLFTVYMMVVAIAAVTR